jgi:hypothetical protein
VAQSEEPCFPLSICDDLGVGSEDGKQILTKRSKQSLETAGFSRGAAGLKTPTPTTWDSIRKVQVGE